MGKRELGIFMLEKIYEYLIDMLDCTKEDLDSEEIRFVINKKEEHFLKIVGIGQTTIVSVSKDLYDLARTKLIGLNRDELFESELVYGQTIHYVPVISNMTGWENRDDVYIGMLVGKEVLRLYGIHGFENAVDFDEQGNTSTSTVLYARKDGEIIACAGVSYVKEHICEIGVDVKKEYRNRGLASYLVHKLSISILNRGDMLFYSASTTNLLSQKVAIRSGYTPLWIDSFGLRDILF